jgi:hypothetical protein
MEQTNHGLILGCAPKFASKDSEKQLEPVWIVDAAAENLTGHITALKLNV